MTSQTSGLVGDTRAAVDSTGERINEYISTKHCYSQRPDSDVGCVARIRK